MLPADTIYGLSCRALDRNAVERTHEIKRRDKSKPFVILISRIEQLKELGIVSTDVAPALRYWPGALTLVCEARKAPGWLHMGTYSLAVRQPDFPALRELIDEVGPIISTSANLAGGKPAASAAEAENYFKQKLDFYVDTGPHAGSPSTIVKSSLNGLEILRQGAVEIST